METTSYFSELANFLLNGMGTNLFQKSNNMISGIAPVFQIGLTHEEIRELTQLAKQRYGKASVSWMAKRLLKAQLEKEEPELIGLPPPKSSKRVTIRLPDKDRAYLEEAAKRRGGTINDAIRDIIQTHISRHPILSAVELDELHHSNYQLLSIGRNLNQIAHKLNAGEPVSLTSQYIAELREIINNHTERVGRVLHTQRRRKK